MVHELMSSPSSRASTPATPLSVTPRKPLGKTPVSTPCGTRSDIVITTEQLVSKMTSAYLCFFDKFVKESVFEDKEKGIVFNIACQLLVLMAMFGTSKEYSSASTDSQGMCK